MRVLLAVLLLSMMAMTTPAQAAVGADDDELAADSAHSPGYRLFPGDLVSIQVYDHADLSVTVRIPASGRITFPLIGEVEAVVGRPLDQFTAEISHRLEKDFVRQAIITATVLEFGPRRAYVMGSVGRPGFIELSPFAPLTALQAIGQSGGFQEDANRSSVQVIRADLRNPGRKRAIPVPIPSDGAELRADPQLQDGDIILVPRLDRVYIIGQVRSPGAVNLPTGSQLTVSKAVSLAGGFDRFAKQKEVQLIRVNADVRVVDVRAILTGSKGEDPALRPGDTIFVPESRF
jgi:polysaccharide export outer membrane protein